MSGLVSVSPSQSQGTNHDTSFLLQSRYFECMQVYALPMECREVAESKGTVEIVSRLTQSQRAEGQESNSFRRLENIKRSKTSVEMQVGA